MAARPSGAHVGDLAQPGRDRADIALRSQEPGAVGHDGPHARIVRCDHGKPGRHRLDQDDAERLGRLGGEEEQVRSAQDVGQLGVGNRAEEVDALADTALCRSSAEVLDQLAAARDDDVDALVAQLCERVDRHVQALEVVGAVEGGDEGRDDRVARGCRAACGWPDASGPGLNRSASTPFGITISFDGSRSPVRLRYETDSAWSGLRTQTRSDARINAGATECS